MAQPRPLVERLEQLDWPTVEADLDERGYAHRAGLLTPDECRELIALFGAAKRFRSTVVMERHQYGRGTYKYFAYPLPDLVAELRSAAYTHLAPIANRWRERVMRAEPFPPGHEELLEVCRQAGQARPTPLMLYYTAGGYNELHRDLYGRVAFPLQLVVILSRRGESPGTADFSGGEFLLTETPKDRPEQSWAVPATQGDVIIFATKFRPESTGERWRQSPLRHGAQEVTSGERFALGVIFHDAKR